MNKKLKATSLPGRPSPDVAPYEAAHRETARIAAEEGFVLLKNEHDILPLAKNSKLALYGAGVSNPIKGGTLTAWRRHLFPVTSRESSR